MAEMKKTETTPGTDAAKYTVRELAAAAGIFKASPDCVTAALKAAGILEATKDEARKIVSKFMTAPVPTAHPEKEAR